MKINQRSKTRVVKERRLLPTLTSKPTLEQKPKPWPPTLRKSKRRVTVWETRIPKANPFRAETLGSLKGSEKRGKS
jgi:hypothetical protein